MIEGTDYQWTHDGGVYHRVLVKPSGQMTLDGTSPEPSKPFVPPMRECHSIDLGSDDVVVDIGAYCGTYAIWASQRAGRVVAYEPTPRSFEVLSLSQASNLRVIRAAVVGDDREVVDLWISPGVGVTNSTTVKKGYAIGVPAVNYRDAVADATVVKVDIEGGEYDLPLVQPSLRAIIVDFHQVGERWVKKAKHLIGEMEAAGFEAVVSPNFSTKWAWAGSWRR